jgi:4-aminobutyrate aminotransferase-like enzyme
MCPYSFLLFSDSGKGSWVYSTDGKKYLDMTCGIGVTNTGHCHPKIVKAAQDQVAKIIHAQVRIRSSLGWVSDVLLGKYCLS